MSWIYWVRRRPKTAFVVILALYALPILLISAHLRLHELKLKGQWNMSAFPSDHSNPPFKPHETNNINTIKAFNLEHVSNALPDVSTKGSDGNYSTVPNEQLRKTRTFYSLADAEAFMKTVPDIRHSPKIVIEYGNYTKHEPNFITAEDRRLFYASETMRQKIAGATASEIRGVMEVVPSGTYQHHFECGWLSNVTYLQQQRQITPGKKFDLFVPLVLDTAYIFQHFYASTIPKLTQIYEYVRRPEVRILLERPTSGNSIIYEMLDKFNISRDRIEWHTQRDHSTVYGAEFMLFACNAPPTHPELWKRIRHYLGVHDRLTVPRNQSKIMFMTRKHGTGAHAVRQAINEAEVLSFLRQRYGSQRIITFTGGQGLQKDIERFSTVSIIIGVHGGALYNLNFAPLDTAIIEFVPTLPGGHRDIPYCSTSIFWLMADLLGQNYWRVQSPAITNANNVEISLQKLGNILDHIDAGTYNKIF